MPVFTTDLDELCSSGEPHKFSLTVHDSSVPFWLTLSVVTFLPSVWEEFHYWGVRDHEVNSFMPMF
jgi:hypothetical protein